MNKIYAPWRSPYIMGTARKQKPSNSTECVFCAKLTGDDKTEFVLKRGKHAMIVLNTYPYSAGHLLIIPNAHAAELTDLDPETRAEMMELASESTKVLYDKLKAHGVNLGMNLGDSAGGGIPDHAHLHVLPRWNGDTNFMPLLCDTKPVSTDLHEVYDILKSGFSE